MKDDKKKIEERLENMKSVYLKAGELIDSLPDTIPEKTRNMLKNLILGDEKLKKLMDGVDAHRPPRVFLIGRTGVGKSSLINSIHGAYVAPVSDTVSCTTSANTYSCMQNSAVLMDIFDTRGLAESESLNDSVSAEEMLLDQINDFSPDVAIMMLNCTHRDDIVADVEFMKKVSKSYAKVNKMKLPIVVVVNKCDEMAPSRHKDPLNYPQSKIDKINEVVQYYKGIIVKNGLKIDSIIPVSSLIDWQTSDGMEIDVDDIANLPNYDIDNIKIAFDGRYGIEDLIDTLLDAILDCEAQMGLRMASRLDEVINRFAKHLNQIFSSMAATVAITPIPVSDIYILLIIQTSLVTSIATLSGREISIESAKEFIFSLGSLGVVGFGFKLAAQQTTKFLNFVAPGSGSAISAGIAYAGTYAIGTAATSYYIDGVNLEEVKKKFEDSKKEENNTSSAM